MDLEKNQSEETDNGGEQQSEAGFNPFFPPKPMPAGGDNPLMRSVLSLAFFVFAFYLLFGSFQYVLLMLLVLLIHEAGHLIAMKMFGYKELNIFFIPLLGAAVTGTKERISQRQRVIILMAGPLPGLIIGSLLVFWGVSQGNENFGTIGAIFIFINAFNLLPFTPLDGGKVVETMFFSNNEVIKMVFYGISCTGLIGIGLYTESYVLVFFGALWISRIRQENRKRIVHDELDAEGIEFRKSYNELTDREYWLIRRSWLRAGKKIPIADPDVFRTVKQEPILMTQVKNVLYVPVDEDMTLGGKIIWVIIWLIAFVGPVTGLMMLLLKAAISGAA